jgi:hypothetical protein
MNQIDNHIHEIIYQSFVDSKNYFSAGMVMGMYRLLALFSFFFALTSIVQNKEDVEEYVPLKSLNIYSVCLPIFVLLYDCKLQKLKGRKEFWFLKFVKIFYIITYWALMAAVFSLFLRDPTKTVTIIREIKGEN